MTVAVQDFITLGGTAYDLLDWSSGQTRIIKDSTTGDLLVWKWTSANNAMPLYSSQDNGATWSLVVSDASGASGSQPNWIQSVWQDTTNGNIHCVSSSSSNVYTYTRFALTRSGGHVTGYSIDRAAYSLPTHSFDAASDRRADIKTFMNGSTEQVVICFQGGTTAGPNTDLRVYMCIMSSLTGTSTSTGLLGTGSDTQVYSHTTGGNITNHVFQALLVQETTNKTAYCAIGKINTDYAESFAASSDWDLFAIPFTPVAGTWVQQSAVVIHSIPGGGGTPPQLCSVYGAAGVASIQYYSENGISFAKFDSSGTLTDRYVTEPYTTGTRSGFGGHTTDGTNIACTFGHYGSVGASPAAASGYWNGSAWTITALTVGATGAEGWANYQHDGSSPLQHFGMWFKGSTLAQSRSGDAIAGVWTYTLEQNAFRARNDDGSETTATFAAAQSANLTAPKDVNLRLRYLLNATGPPPTNTYRLEYKLSSDSNYLKVPLDSSSNIASVGTMGTGTSSTSTTTIATTTATNALAIGDTCILVVAADNTSTTDADNSEVSGVTDSAGNTWAKLAEYTNGQGSAAAGTTVSVWMTYATVALPIGSTVTVTFGSARIDKTTSLWKFTSNRKLQQSSASQHNTVNAGNGFGSNTFSGLASKQRLYFMGGSKEANSTTALTVSTSFTTITAQRSRNNAAAQMVRGEFRINTSTGETSNPTLAVSGDAASVFIALEETLPPITMSASSNIAASAATATTSQLTGGSGSFTAGRISDDTNPMPTIRIGSGGNSEFEWCVSALSANGAADAQIYNLRVTNAGTDLDTYTNSLSWTIGTAGGGTTISPSVGSLAFTGITPAVTQQLVRTPTVGTVALTGIAAQVSQGTVITPSSGSLSLTWIAPSALQGAVRVPTVGAIAFTGVAPALIQGTVLTPPVGSITWTGIAPIVTSGAGGSNTTITPLVGSLTLTGQFPIQTLDVESIGTGAVSLTGIAPVVLQGTGRVPSAGAVVFNGLTPSVLQTFTITPTVGSIALAGQTVFVGTNGAISPSVGSVNLTGNAPVVTEQAARSPSVGSISLTGIAPVISQGLVLTPNSGLLTLTGTLAQVGMTIVTAPTAGSLSLAGQFPVISLTTGAPGTGTVTLQGSAPVITQGTVMVPSAGQLSVSGVAPVLSYSYTDIPVAGTLTLQGAAPQVTQGAIRTPSVGAVSLTGQTAAVSRGTLIVPNAGTLTMSGNSAQVLAGQLITPIAGAILVTGNLPSLIFGVIKPPSGQISLTGSRPSVDIYDPNSSGNVVGPGARLKLNLVL